MITSIPSDLVRLFMDTGKLRYLAIGLGSGLLAFGAYIGMIDDVSFGAGVAAIIAIAAADQIKHRND